MKLNFSRMDTQKEQAEHQPWHIISCLWQWLQERDSGRTKSKA